MATTPADDGRLVREVGEWTGYKLDIVEAYAQHFATACKDKARAWFFIDGFCGPGVNRVKPAQTLRWGSPVLGLLADPPFKRCIAMDLSERDVEALRSRVQQFGDRAVVEVGNCNVDLLPLMERTITGGDRFQPCLALLDPEGPHLAWSTVAAISRFRRGRRKAEQLILLPTHMGFIRELPLHNPITSWAERDLRRVYGNDDWRGIWERRKETGDTDRATTEYVQLYEEQLRALGYRTVLDVEIKREGRRGPTLYFLIFATDHPAGERIMDSLFDSAVPEREDPLGQLSLGLRLPRRKRTRGSG